MTRRLIILGVLAVTVLTAPPMNQTTAGTERPQVRRLLVLSLPHTTWGAMEVADTPNLDALFDEASLANLSVRVERRKTQTDTGYTTIGAGTRALGLPTAGLAFGPEERFEGGSALQAYERRMGHASSADVLVMSVPDLVERNDRELYGAEIGALGEALDEAGIGRSVVANADLVLDERDVSDFRREAAVTLMDERGRVSSGRVDRGLLTRDAAAPFGIRFDHDAVVDAFEEGWRARAVVLVEASDLIRAESYRKHVEAPLRDPLSVQALEDADRLAGRLFEKIDFERDAVLVVAPASPRGQARLTIAALRAPGVEPSLMRSSTTRRDGFLTIYDLGAGITRLMDVERPASMEGRPLETGRRDGDGMSRREHLADEAEEAVFRDDTVGMFTALFVALQLALTAAAVLALRYRRARGIVAMMALLVLALLPMTYFAGLIDFFRHGLSAYLTFVFIGAGAAALAAWVLGRRDPVVSVGSLLALVVGVIVGNVVLTNSVLQFSTVFGDSPIVAGRFSGINNLTFAQLAGGGIILAVLLAHRLGGRRGALAAVSLMAFLLIVDGFPGWGADVGGVLTAVPAFAYVGYRLLGSRVRIRTFVIFGVATLLAIAAFAVFDLAQPEDQRTHLGRLLEQVDAQGSDAFVTVVLRKLFANMRVITSSVWLLMVPGALAFVAFIMWRRPRLIRVIENRIPTFAIALGGLLVTGVLGFALNDSGIAVPGMVLGVFNPVMVHLSLRMEGMEPAGEVSVADDPAEVTA